MTKHIEEILSDIGWADGFRIPVANEENKILETEVENKLKSKAKLATNLEELNDRLNVLSKNVQNLSAEYQQNQALIAAHRSQLQTEEHLYILAKSEEEKLQQLLRDINKNFTQLGVRHTTLQNDILHHSEKLEKLKSNVKWDKEELSAVEEDMARGEDDTTTLCKFRHEDEKKAKDLELKRQNLQLEVENKKKLVVAIVSDVDALEKMLERTAEMFRKLHQERKELIDQWESSVGILHQRDSDINRAVEEMNLLRMEGREKLDVLEEQKNFFENQVSNNRELERQITLLTRNVAVKRDESSKLSQLVDELMSECLILQRTLSATGAKLDNQRTRNNQMHQENESKQKQIEKLKIINTGLKERLEKVNNRSATAAEQAKQLEEMFQAEQKALLALERESGRAQDILFRMMRQVNELIHQKELQSSEIQCVEASKSSLRNQLHQTEKEIARQQEILYGLDYEAHRLESRIERMKGKADQGSNDAEEDKINEMQKILAGKTETFNMLTNEVQRDYNTDRRLTSEVSKGTEELERLQQRLRDMTQLAEGGRRQLLGCKTRAQERQLEHNMLQFRVHQAERAIAREGDHLFTLEKQRLELEKAMKDRQEEINVQRELLNIKKRVLNEEKSKLVMDIQERKLKITQLQKKYDIAMMSFSGSGDGEETSVAALKLKAAQEKYQLQEQGDELDAKIRKAEKEIQAMENTLKLVNISNENYKKSLSTVDEESPEYQEKRELEGQYYAAVDHLRSKQSEITALNKDIEMLEQTMKELLNAEEEVRCSWRDKDQEAAELDHNLQEQQSKLARAETQLRRQQKEIRGSTRRSVEEKDIATRELQEQNLSALQQLAELVAEHIETGPVVGRYLVEKGLELPLTTRTQSSRSRSQIPTSASSTEEGKSVGHDVTTPSSSRSLPTPTSPSVVTLDIPEQLQGRICSTAAARLKKPKKSTR